MSNADLLLQTLRTWHKMPAGQLLERLGISRATLMRAAQELGEQVVMRGRARRSSYAARRAVRGNWQAAPLYRIDEAGQAHEVATLSPLYPEGCALEYREAVAWPMDDDMRDGWFEGLPYFLEDMRPQGFLGRHFARNHASMLQVGTDPRDWSEDDVIHVLSLLGSDQPGNYVLGEPALRHWLAQTQQELPAIAEDTLPQAYLQLAAAAMAQGQAGSSTAGEFPKFTAYRTIAGQSSHVIVKFSGLDDAPGTVRWSDLLICEHLALGTVAKHLGVDVAVSSIHQAGGRTFLEVERFDRSGRFGRSPVCSWLAINAALLGKQGISWPEGMAALHTQQLIDEASVAAVQRIWWFGKLIANNDMHDGNLSFRPDLQLAPVYDMLPMAYAPVRGVELPAWDFIPHLPLPGERDAWSQAARAAADFWTAASQDARISGGFRAICAANAEKLNRTQARSE